MHRHIFTPSRPCTKEHLKTLTTEFDQCLKRGRSRLHCSDETFGRCLQWTSLDSRQDYLDFLGRPYNDRPSDLTFAGQQYLERTKHIQPDFF